MEFPKELKYSKEHIWLKTQGSKAAIGITEFAQIVLGEIVYVNLPSKGARLDKDEVFGSVEVLKTTADLLMPVGGVVLEKNNNLLKQADLLNNAPYKEGWIMKIQLTDITELDDLLDADAYKRFVG